jgi:hypothetical protein
MTSVAQKKQNFAHVNEAQGHLKKSQNLHVTERLYVMLTLKTLGFIN